MKIFKKLFVILIVCFLVSLSFFNIGKVVKTNANKDIFAKIETNDCLLLSSNQTPLFLLPKSYFVKIKDKLSNYYFVEFKNIEGYVLTDKVTLCDTPENPYPNKFVLNLKQADYLYSSPNLSSKISPLDSKTNLEYIGSTIGENIEQYGGNIWYYVKVENSNVAGYIYGSYTTGISGQNNSSEYTTSLVNSYEEIKGMSKSTFVILIILLCIPMTIIMSLVFSTKQKT